MVGFVFASGRKGGSDAASFAEEEIKSRQGPDACFGYGYPYKNAQPPLRRIHLLRALVNSGKGLYKKENASMSKGRERASDRYMAESQLSELQNMRVLLEEARGLSRNLAYHRRARLEAELDVALEEVDRQIGELRADRR